MKRCDVICVGQAVIDCITRGQEAEAYRENVFRAEQIRLATGGDAVNESFNLAKMGYAVRLVCGVGEDLAGSILTAQAKKRGIDISRIRVLPEMATPIASLMVRKDGSRLSVNSPATMLEGYLPEEADMEGGKIVSFASLFRAPLDQPAVVKRLIEAAHRSGAIVCCDTKLPTYRSMSMEDLKEVLPLVDYIFPNEKEAAFHTGKSTYPEMAQALRALGIKNVVIKAGAEGCYASLAQWRGMLPPRCVNAVDTTGAGDAFVSGFIAGLMEGRPGRDCLESALDHAAECVTHMGAVRDHDGTGRS